MTVNDTSTNAAMVAKAIKQAWEDCGEVPFPLYDREAEKLAKAAIAAVHANRARPVWAHVYRGVVHTPDGDNDLIPVTRETLRLAFHALQKQNEQDYYHNYGAASNELYMLLGATQSSGYPTDQNG